LGNGNKGGGIVIRNGRGDIMVSAYEKLPSTSCSGGYISREFLRWWAVAIV